MNNVLGDALKKAIDAKKGDYSNFVWKGEKIKEGKSFVQENEKMSEMTPERLKECWQHCDIMLNNDNPKILGRYNVLQEVISQITKCNTELFLRYLENSYQKQEFREVITRFSFMLSLRTLMANNPEIEDWSKVSITKIASELPAEFNNLTIENVLDGCTDDLGSFNKQHLTLSFLTKMGLWLTKGEQLEFKGISNTEKLKIIKNRLHLPNELVLKFSSKGLSFKEMKSMLSLPAPPRKIKYSEMTTDQLVILRNKVLLRLSRILDTHIHSWNRLKRQLEIVARNRGINLNDLN